ncbi:MAG: DUF2341 domain-containing protein, partial [Gammaproteobacteria bacterium]|nr:DUF2341 domain-containing protein [Gammaproteobacteria bacterium]
MKKQSNHKKQNSKIILEELEARQLFSGGLEGVIVNSIEPAIATYIDIDSTNDTVPAQTEISSASAEDLQSHEIVFVDTGVNDYQILIDDILNNSDSSRNIEVVLLDSEHNGIEQISATLQNMDDLDAIHIISHGDDGSVQLGNVALNADSLSDNNLSIALWANSFDEAGDILIYGCNLAATDVGESLINSLSELTLTDVAASDDLTGSADMGGDWVLEFNTGTIETKIALSESIQSSFSEVLIEKILTASQDTYIYKNFSGDNFGSSTSLIVDEKGHDPGEGFILMEFDLSSVPAGSVITGATLTAEAASIDGSIDIGAYELTETWDESTATYNNSSGINYNSSAEDTLSTNTTGQHSWDITTLVQNWFDGSTTNNGIMLSGSGHGGTKVNYNSSESGGVVPKLTITYTDVSAPTIISKETADLDGDGSIDAIHITFDEAIDDSTIVASDFDVAGVAGEAFSSTTNGDTANDEDIYITFNDGELNSGATPDVTYTQGTLADTSGNLLASDNTDTWLDSNWLNRSQITFDNSASTENLVDFPVLVTLNATDLPSLDLSAVVGADVRFTDANGVELNYEVESWDDTTDTATIWVKVPQIDLGSTTDYINLYYNYDGTATYDQSSADEQAVWSASYEAVWHLDEQVTDGQTSGTHDDSVGLHDGTQNNNEVIAGQIDNAQNFDGSGDFITIADDDALSFVGGDGDDGADSAFSVSAWINSTTAPSFSDILAKCSSSNGEWEIYLKNGRAAFVVYDSDFNYIGQESSTNLSGTGWHYLTATYDGSNSSNGVHLYVDGVEVGSNYSDGAYNGMINTTEAVSIGALNDATEPFTGQIDEARISNGVRSADWVKASYLTQNGDFSTYGAEEMKTTDKAAPVILSQETADLDGDGSIDAIHVTFSEAIDDSTVVASDFDVAGVAGEVFSSTTNGDTANDSDIYITFNDGELNSGATPDVTYTQGTLADTSGNLLASNSTDTWLDSNWLNRTQITFDNSASSMDLTDFPVLVTINTTDLPGLDLSTVVGADVRFTDASGTELKYEVESWDDTADTATVWVKVPLITAGSTTEHINIYYNYDGTATYDQSTVDEQAVWSTGIGVYHLNEDPGPGVAGDIKDSDGTANNGTAETSMTSGDLVTGQIGNAIHFDGADDYIDFTTTDVGDSFTISVWIKPDSSSTNIQTIASNSSSGNATDGFRFFINSNGTNDGKILFETGNGIDGNGADTATGVINFDQWNHVTVEVDRISGLATIYHNGVDVTVDSTIRTDFNTSSDWAIGRMEGSNEFTGTIDEFRVSNTTLSADWIKASYLSQNGSFNTFGNEEVATTDKAVPVVSITDDIAGTATGDVTYTFTFSEAVSNFTIDDIDITGGTKGTFTVVSATEYTLAITPTDHSTTNITVDVAANVAQDAVGLNNVAATQSVQIVDTTNKAPTLTATSQDPTFTEGDSATALFSSFTANTVESGETIEELVFTVTNVTDGNNELITVDGSSFILSNLNTGTTAANGYGYAISLSGSTATITLTTTGTSAANIDTLGNSISYQNTSENPTANDRVFTITGIKDSGGTVNGGVDTYSPNLVSTLTLVSVNDAPTAFNDTLLDGAEDSTSAVLNTNMLSNDTDPENDSLSVTAINATALIGGVQSISVTNGTVNIDASDNITFTADANYNGAVSFDYTVSDGNLTDTATVSGTISAVDDAATIGGDISSSGDEDAGAITGTLTAVDAADGFTDSTYFSVTAAASNGTANIDAETGAWSYTPNADYNGVDVFTVTITDDDGHTTTQAISLTVNAVDDAATIGGDV